MVRAAVRFASVARSYDMPLQQNSGSLGRPRLPMTDWAEKVFESLAREMLARNPAIRHEWWPVRDRWWGDRLDLVCNPDAPYEVWASIREGQIAVGAGEDHDDFEDFRRGLSESALAYEAFGCFVALLRENGYPEAAA